MTDTRNADLTFASSDFLVHIAPQGTPAPTDFSDLSSPWVCLGWMTQDGSTTKTNRQTKDIFASGSLAPIRTITTQQTREIQMITEEAINPQVRAVYDDVPLSDLSPTSGVASYDLPDTDPDNRYCWIFDSWDGDHRIRDFAPNGKVTARGDEKRAQTDAAQLDMTVTCYKAVDGSPSMSRLLDYGTTDVSAYFA